MSYGMDQLTAFVGYCTVEEVKEVPFRPSDKTLARLPYKGAVGDRYLYRVYVESSKGMTNYAVAKSQDAYHTHLDYYTDIFVRQDRVAAAHMLNRHLRWVGNDDEQDKFVSWPSSLLFALKYAFYRASKHRTPFNAIKLCMIDTTQFETGTFMKDLDLITAFAPINSGLADLGELRKRKPSACSGVYYFGEYLSQGLLSLRNRCSIVAVSDIIQAGLRSALPDLVAMRLKDANLAEGVIQLREDFYFYKHNGMNPPETTSVKTEAAMRIGALFGPAFKAPMALACLALQPRCEPDDGIMMLFTDSCYGVAELADLASAKTKFDDSEGSLPELHQLNRLLATVREHLRMLKVRAHAKDVRRRLELFSRAVKALRNPHGWESNLLYTEEEELIAEIDIIQNLAGQLF